jgi:acetyltransferase
LIEQVVSERAGKEHFLGVTVQKMVRLDGYELIIGSSLDPQFGPVLLFGTGGVLVEVFKDRALGLPPLTTTLARRMMEQTKIYDALKGIRGHPPVNLAALEQLMVRFSQLVVEQRWIKEIDINPLLASPDRLLGLDARVVIHGKDVPENQLPKTAIRPYPVQYISKWKMEDGPEFTIRPIRPEDEPTMVRFHETLSEQSVYLRYFHFIKLSERVAHERLSRICFIDYDREMVLVAEYFNEETSQPEIIAAARLSKVRDSNEAEFGLLISDKFQKRGLGTELLRRLVEVGRDEGLSRITGDILSANYNMQHISEKLGFRITRSDEPSVVRAELDL